MLGRRTGLRFLESQTLKLSERAPYTVMIGGMATVSSALAFVKKFPERSSQLTVCSTKPWVENIAATFKDIPWGQPAWYLPPETYSIYLGMRQQGFFPNHPEKSLMTIGMVGQIMAHQQRVLEESGVNLVTDEIFKVEHHNGRLRFTTNNDEVSVATDENYVVFNAAHRTRIPDKLKHLVPAQNTSLLYQRSQLTDVIAIYGTGKNAIWALRDTTCRVLLLVPENTSGLDSHFDNPSYQHRITRLTLKDTSFKDLGEDLLVEGYDKDRGKEVTMRIPKTSFYSAYGSELNTGITASLDKQHVVLIPNSPTRNETPVGSAGANPKDKEWQSQSIIGGYAAAGLDFRDTKLPYGSMIHNYYRILGRMGIMSHTDPRSLLNFHAWQILILERIYALNMVKKPNCDETTALMDEFFQKTQAIIISIHQHQVPPPEIVARVVEVIADQTFKHHAQDKLKVSLQEFKEQALGKEPQKKLTP